MFIYLFVCFFVSWPVCSLFHPPMCERSKHIVRPKAKQRGGDCIFVHLFVCLFIFCLFFYLHHLGIPTERFSKDQTWLSWDIVNPNICLFVCLFFCLFVDRFVFLFKSSWNSHRNIPWKFCEDPIWFGWDIKD